MMVRKRARGSDIWMAILVGDIGDAKHLPARKMTGGAEIYKVPSEDY